jgi:FkbM family methyltransferase
VTDGVAPDDHGAIVERFLDALPPDLALGGVIHVGAHEGQEVDAYLARGCTRIVLVEANPEACRVLRERFGGRPEVHIIEAAALDHDGTATLRMHTSRRGSTEPASILELKRFKEIVRTLATPTTIEVSAARLDTLLEREGIDAAAFQLLNVDVQGVELQVLTGAERTLESVDAVLTEVHVVELYAGGASEGDVEAFLAERGFERVAAEYHELYDEQGSIPAWGEVLYARRR